MHLVPGLLNIKKFQEDAAIHFFILTADEETHKERFVKRAMKIKRGGKHLEYFKENRIINNYLVKQARDHHVPVINNLDLDNTKKRMLTIIRENCTELVLQHTVDQLEEVTHIVLNKYGVGSWMFPTSYQALESP